MFLVQRGSPASPHPTILPELTLDTCTFKSLQMIPIHSQAGSPGGAAVSPGCQASLFPHVVGCVSRLSREFRVDKHNLSKPPSPPPFGESGWKGFRTCSHPRLRTNEGEGPSTALPWPGLAPALGSPCRSEPRHQSIGEWTQVHSWACSSRGP